MQRIKQRRRNNLGRRGARWNGNSTHISLDSTCRRSSNMYILSRKKTKIELGRDAKKKGKFAGLEALVLRAR